jgi:hypothetical protein
MLLNAKVVFHVLIIAFISVYSLIIFGEGSKVLYSNWIIIIGASVAVGLALYVVVAVDWPLFIHLTISFLLDELSPNGGQVLPTTSPDTAV